MSMTSDFARLQQKNLRKRRRLESESDLKKSASDPRSADLATTVTANRKKAEQSEKLNQLRRNR